MPSARYWGIRPLKSNGLTFVCLAEVQLCTTPYTDLASGKTASADFTFVSDPTTFAPGKAVDGSVGTCWLGDTNKIYGNKWWVDMGSAVEINHVVISSRNVPNEHTPPVFEVIYSSDATNWSIAWTVVTTTWSNNQTRYFDKPGAEANARYWGIRTLTNADATGLAYSEIELRSSVLGSDLTTSKTAYVTHTDGAAAGNLIDNSYSTGWGAGTVTGANVISGAITYVDFGAGNETIINQVLIASLTNGFHTQAPRTFDVVYSFDGVNFATAWSGSTSAWNISGGERRVFTRSSLIPAADANAAHRLWGVRCITTTNAFGNMGFSEFEVRASVGGADETTGKTADSNILSTVFTSGSGVDKMIDDNNSTQFQVARSPVTVWVDLGAGGEKRAAQFAIKAPSTDPDQVPITFDLIYSDTGGFGEWNTVLSVVGDSNFSSSEQRTYLNPGYVAGGGAGIIWFN